MEEEERGESMGHGGGEVVSEKGTVKYGYLVIGGGDYIVHRIKTRGKYDKYMVLSTDAKWYKPEWNEEYVKKYGIFVECDERVVKYEILVRWNKWQRALEKLDSKEGHRMWEEYKRMEEEGE